MKMIINISEQTNERVKRLNPNESSTSLLDRLICAVHDGIPYEDRPTGKWITHEGWDSEGVYGMEFSCSECNEWVNEKSEYCPKCGAKME